MRTLALSMARICVLLMPLLCGCIRITEFAMTGQDAANPHDAPSTERQDLDRQRMDGRQTTLDVQDTLGARREGSLSKADVAARPDAKRDAPLPVTDAAKSDGGSCSDTSSWKVAGSWILGSGSCTGTCTAGVQRTLSCNNSSGPTICNCTIGAAPPISCVNPPAMVIPPMDTCKAVIKQGCCAQ